MKEAIIVFVVALVIGAGINQFAGSGSPAAPDQQSAGQAGGGSVGGSSTGTGGGGSEGNASAAAVPETSDATFSSDVLQASQPVFVDFNATWCGPCKMMAPVVASLAGQYQGKAKFFSVDVDKCPSTAANYNVNAIPTFIMFKGGKRGESFTGVVPKVDLTQALNRTLQ